MRIWQHLFTPAADRLSEFVGYPGKSSYLYVDGSVGKARYMCRSLAFFLVRSTKVDVLSSRPEFRNA